MKFPALLAAACLADGVGAALAVLRGGGSSLAMAQDASVTAPHKIVPRPLLPTGVPLPVAAGADTSDEFLEAMMVRIAQDPASLGGIAKVIKPMLDTLLKQVDAGHKAAKKALTDSLATIEKCKGGGGGTSTGGSSAADLKKQYDGAKQNLTTCGTSKTPLQATLKTCEQTATTLKGTHDMKCKKLKEKPTPNVVGDTCNMIPSDNLETWLERMEALWEKQYKDFAAIKSECDALQKNIDKQTGKCTQEKKVLSNVGKGCSTTKDKLQQTACSLKQALSQGCSDYDGCYKRTVKAHEDLVAASKTELETRKAQFRMYKRLECLVNSYDFSTGKVDKAKIDACGKNKYNTDSLNLAYPSPPAKGSCKVDLSGIDANDLANCK